MENSEKLSKSFILLETDEFIKQSKFITSNVRFPKGGLLFKVEFDFYYTALKNRSLLLPENHEIRSYIKHVELCKEAFDHSKFKEYEIFDTEPLLNSNYVDDFGNSGLIAAVDLCFEDYYLPFFEKLCFQNQDINKSGKFGDGPLDHAVIIGNLKVIQILLKNGVDVNRKSAFNGTAIHWLSCANIELKNKREILKLFISNGANLNIKDSFGMIPSDYDSSLFHT